MTMQMRKGLHVFLFLLALSVAPVAAFGAQNHQGFQLQGQLYDEQGSYPIHDFVDFEIRILAPNSECLLYSEAHGNVDLALTGGVFSFTVGSAVSGAGAAKRAASDPGLTMAQVFSNNGVIRPVGSANCAGGYSPQAGDGRRLRLSVRPQSTGVFSTLSPDQVIASVPQAITAETLQGLEPGQFIQVAGNTAPYTASKTALDVLFGTGGGVQDASSLHHHDSRYAKLDGGGSLTLSPQTTLGLGRYSSTQESAMGLGPSDVGKTWYNSDTNEIRYWDGSSVKALGVGGAGSELAFSAPLSKSGSTVSLPAASSVSSGYLSSGDWLAFSGKQAAGNYLTALTGDVTASGPAGGGSGTATLANVGTAGTYTKVTTDAKGRVTSGATLAAGDIPDLSWSKITLDKPTTLAGYGITDSLVKNAGGTPSISSGNEVAMPTAGTVGRIYIAGDTYKIFRDNGAAWDLIASAGGGGGGGTVTNVSGTGPISVINGSSTPEISIATASSTTTGALSSGDWSIFNNKENALTFSGPLSRAGNVISIPAATALSHGYLSKEDYIAFTAKQPAGNYLTALTGDITASGPGNAVATLANVGTAGTYTKVTTDAKGRVTSGASLAAGDIPDLDWSKITSGKPTTLSGYGITDGMKNTDGVPAMAAGPFASRPSSGMAGRLYIATDANVIYRDTGTAWATLLISGLEFEMDTLASVTGRGATTTSAVTFAGGATVKGTTIDSSAAALNVTDSTSISRLYVRNDGNVGIGTTSPLERLDVDGRIRATQLTLTGGSLAAGKVLTSDANGVASWETPASAPVTSVAGKTGAVTLTAADISGLGAAATLNVGTAANQVVQMTADAKLPAVDASQLTNLNASNISSGLVSESYLPFAGGASSGILSSTDWDKFNIAALAVQAATDESSSETLVKRDDWGGFAAGQITAASFMGSGAGLTDLPANQLTGTVSVARMPAFSGDIVTTAGDTSATVSRIQGVPVSSTAPQTGQILRYNGTEWQPAKSTLVTCPEGMTEVGTLGQGGFCISTTPIGSNSWIGAVNDCASRTPAARLCSIDEWTMACVKLGWTGGGWEWVAAHFDGTNSFVLSTSSGCTGVSYYSRSVTNGVTCCLKP